MRVTPRRDPANERRLAGWSIAIAFGGTLLLPLPAWAQAGFYVTPSLALGEVYDDNIFATPSNQPPPQPGSPPPQGRQSDFIFRVTPAVLVGYQSKPFTLLGGYSITGEEYAKESNLSTIPAAQNATLETTYVAYPLLALSLSSGYLQSEQAQQLNAPESQTVTGIQPTALQGQRARTSAYHVGPSASYKIDQLTTAVTGYDFSHTQQVGQPSSDTHQVSASLDRRITPLDTADLVYTFRRFSFPQSASPAAAPPTGEAPTETPTPSPPQPNDVTYSNAVTLGWTREVTPRTRISLGGGPNFTEGSVKPVAFANISYKLSRGLLGFGYNRTQTTAVGVSGTIDTASYTGTASYQPMLDMVVTTSLFFYRNSQSGTDSQPGTDSDVYGATLSARYRILKWLSLIGSYAFSYEDGSLGTLTNPGGRSHIYRNIVGIGLEASQPYRVY
jgi:hypothetical protein